jgi:hypothetical protein
VCFSPGMEAQQDLHRSGINAPGEVCDETIPKTVMELEMELRLLILGKYEPILPGELQADQED